ncbi:myogenesis-regulating glycosidase-like [Clytia hemisphaerica]|uniref:Uncharacterized protein n=1 Tax=Clytia hemisphaerica TaxID=252671 RepID=A0A7M5TYW3_9CNID
MSAYPGNNDKLSSISEYGDYSTRTSLTGLSMFSGSPYSQSPSGGSLSTLASVSTRSYQPNGSSQSSASGGNNQIMTQRVRGAPKHNYEFCKKVRVSMALLGILVLVAAIFMLSFYLPKQYEEEPTVLPPEEPPLWDDMISYKVQNNELLFTFAQNVTSALSNPTLIALKANFGVLLSAESKENITIKETNSTLRMTFLDKETGKTTLEIEKSDEYPQCFEVKWTTKYQNKLDDCFDIISSHWYGLGEVFTQKWPLDKAKFEMTPFLTADFIDEYISTQFGGVLEPFLINSRGAGIYIDDHVPLHISMDENDSKKMCLRADPTTEYSRMYKEVPSNATNVLKYTICVEENIKKVHKLLFDRFIEKPVSTPDLEVMKSPIWSTWVRYKREVNQSIVLSMAEQINKYKFEKSHIQIEGHYSKNYGDFAFDTDKFENVPQMLDLLTTWGFKVTLTVSPFINLQSTNFIKSVDFGIKVGEKNVPGISRWWNGLAIMIDTTNPKAQDFFINTFLESFKKLRISGFKFDIGETNYLPEGYKFNRDVPNPNYYSKTYVQMASHYKLSEVRAAYKAQMYPTFVRMLDRTSYWKIENGLLSVVTTALTLSILGYPYIVPDMVGGNAYIQKPNKELYVRWTQLSVFLPCIQFSITPWDYDDEVVGLVRHALEIRKNLTGIMIDAAKKFPETGEPIIRPLWWYWPKEHNALVASTQFMLSDKYLIAPVVHLNIVSHAVYIPPGVWEEQWGERQILNMTTGNHLHYNVTLHDICYFKLLSNLTMTDDMS